MTKSPSAVDVHVGSRLRAGRILRGWSQEQLADSLGLTFQQVQKYERGTNRISAGRLHQMAELLEFPITYFFEDLPTGTKKQVESGQLATQLFGRREGVELARAFVRIENPALRRAVVELVRVAAGQEETSDAATTKAR